MELVELADVQAAARRLAGRVVVPPARREARAAELAACRPAVAVVTSGNLDFALWHERIGRESARLPPLWGVTHPIGPSV